MFAFCLLPFVAVSIVCVGAIPSPSPTDSILLSRAGPSGSVLYPPGGTTFVNLGGTGSIHIQYQTVNTQLPNNEGPANTIGIDLYLESTTGAALGFDGTIANGVRSNPPTAGATIDSYFTPPAGACGTFRLVVIEHQFMEDTVISFRAAAPTISIQCGPIQ